MPTDFIYLERAFRHHQRAEFGEAEGFYRRVLIEQPGNPDAFHLLGVLHFQTDRPEKARGLIEAAIRIAGTNPEYFNNLGETCRRLGDVPGAETSYRQAIALRPSYAVAHNNLGLVLQSRSQWNEAAASFSQAVHHLPEFDDAWNNLGWTFEMLGRFPEAEAAFRRVRPRVPAFRQAQLRLGLLLENRGLVDDAAGHFKTAATISPDRLDAYLNLASIQKESGDIAAALRSFQQALNCDPGNAAVHSGLIYLQLFSPDFSSPQIAASHAEWNRRHAQPLGRRRTPFRNSRDPDRPLRVGCLSPNFSKHVVGANLVPLFEQHRSAAMEIHCFSDVANPDRATEFFRSKADRWHDSSAWSDAQLAAVIEETGIDIAVDLTLHMAGNRLLALARQPAPVLASFAGYPGTTGVDVINYRLTDGYLEPATDRNFFCEEPVRLPSFWCYQPLGRTPAVAPSPCLKNGFVTFGCLNNFCKVTTPTLRLWSRILATVPNSRLILLAPGGSARRRTLAELTQTEFDPARVEFVDRQPYEEYLGTFQRIDIGLDTLPYNGHTTNCDAFWMGVPVVTLVGPTVVGRAGLSQLSNLGLTELITRTEEEYVRTATSLAGDVHRLTELRSSLRDRMKNSPLMDEAGFAAAVSGAFRAMWRRWCAQPDSFS